MWQTTFDMLNLHIDRLANAPPDHPQSARAKRGRKGSERGAKEERKRFERGFFIHPRFLMHYFEKMMHQKMRFIDRLRAMIRKARAGPARTARYSHAMGGRGFYGRLYVLFNRQGRPHKGGNRHTGRGEGRKNPTKKPPNPPSGGVRGMCVGVRGCAWLSAP